MAMIPRCISQLPLRLSELRPLQLCNQDVLRRRGVQRDPEDRRQSPPRELGETERAIFPDDEVNLPDATLVNDAELRLVLQGL